MRISTKAIAPLTLVVAIGLIAHGAVTAELNIGFWGLLHSYPATYFVGIAMLVLSFCFTLAVDRNRYTRWLLAIQTITLLSALWLLPTLVGAHPGNEMAYRNLALVGDVAEKGFGVARNADYYLSCPMFHTAFGLVARWSGFNTENLIPTFPFVMQSLYLFPLFVFLQNVLGLGKEKHYWIGLWVFTLGNWIGQDYFSPQAAGMLLFLLILAVATHPSLVDGSKRVRLLMGATVIALFGLLVTTHLLSSIAILCVLGAYVLAKRYWKLLATVCVGVLMIVVWDCTFGFGYIDRSMDKDAVILEQYYTETMRLRGLTGYAGALTFDPEFLLRTNVTASISGSESHASVVKVRIAYSAMFVVVAGLGTLYTLRKKRDCATLAVFVMALSLLVLVPLRSAGWELAQRLFMLEMPFIAYFCVRLLDTGSKRLIVLLGILLALLCVPFFISHYGNQAVDYWSENHREGLRQVTELQKTSGRWVGELRYIALDGDEVLYDTQSPKTTPYYMPLSKHDDTVYSFIYGKPDFVDTIWEWFRVSPHYESYYRNPEFEIFRTVLLDEKE